jgi:hypothetical protein
MQLVQLFASIKQFPQGELHYLAIELFVPSSKYPSIGMQSEVFKSKILKSIKESQEVQFTRLSQVSQK